MERKIVENLLLGKKIKQIARELKVGKTRVRVLRHRAIEYRYLNESGGVGEVALPPYPEAIFPDVIDGRMLRISPCETLLIGQTEWIKDRLTVGWHAISVYEELPVKVPRTNFYRFLEKHKLGDIGSSLRRVIPEIIHNPGEALILDWGKVCDVIEDEKKKTLWAISGVLGYSRYLMVRFVWSNDVKTTLEAIESMFREMGGVPYKITSDNPKCFALEASDYEPLLNPAFERFASHYDFTIECLPPRDPQKKGKVERTMPFIRRLYEAHGSQWKGLTEAQSYIDKKLVIANERKHGTTMRKPVDVFIQEEVPCLKPLPVLAYEVELFHEGEVRQDGHIRFQNKYYSVDEKYIGEKVTILGNSKIVSIYHKGVLIETHEKLTDLNRSKSTKNHHLKPWERAMEDDSVLMQKATRLGTDVAKVVHKIIENGKGFIDTRKIWGILSLDKKYGKEQINEACRRACEMEKYSYRTVKALLECLCLECYEPAITEDIKSQGEYQYTRPLSEYQDQLILEM